MNAPMNHNAALDELKDESVAIVYRAYLAICRLPLGSEVYVPVFAHLVGSSEQAASSALRSLKDRGFLLQIRPGRYKVLRKDAENAPKKTAYRTLANVNAKRERHAEQAAELSALLAAPPQLPFHVQEVAPALDLRRELHASVDAVLDAYLAGIDAMIAATKIK